MSDPIKLDGRRAGALEEELRRRAEAVLSSGDRSPAVGETMRAILAVAARIGEEVTRRLDLAPAKQAANFYTAAGIGRDPARPATLPVAFKLVDGVEGPLSAAGGTQLMADAGGPVIFETETRIDLVPGTIAAVRGLDAGTDAVSMPAAAFLTAKLPRATPIERRLRSGAAAGATKLQVDPAAGLEVGMLLELGAGDAARHYEAVAVEGDLVTIAPPLEVALDKDATAREVTGFAPFGASTRNHQSHSLYLGHESVLDLPSAVTITITGAALPDGTTWSWWGKLDEDDPPAWQELEPEFGAGISFAKQAGKPAKTKVDGRESLWLRAKLPGKSAGSVKARDVRIAIGGGGACSNDRKTRCRDLDAMNVGYEAIAATTPVVANKPFHPFGREPRLYDSFYVGSNEAFSKAGADATLCFDFAGANLGPLTGVVHDRVDLLFGVGSDGLLYRLRLSRAAEQPSVRGFASAPAGTPTSDFRPVASPQDGELPVYLKDRSPVAAWRQDSETRAVAASRAKGLIHVATSQFDDVRAEAVKWARLRFDSLEDVSALAIITLGTPTLYALAGRQLFSWKTFADETRGTPDLTDVTGLLPLAGEDNALVLTVGAAGVSISRLDNRQWLATVPAGELPSEHLRAHLQSNLIYFAGYDGEEPILRLVRVSISNGDLQQDSSAAETMLTMKVPEKLPVTFSPEKSGDEPPLLTLAFDYPRHISWYQEAESMKPRPSDEPHSIGSSTNPYRSFVNLGGYTYVQRPNEGLLYRTAIEPGFSVGQIREGAMNALLIAEDVPDGAALAIAGRGRVYRISDPSRPHPSGPPLRLLDKIVTARTNLSSDENVALFSLTRTGTLAPGEGDTVTIENSGTLRQITIFASRENRHRLWRFNRGQDETGDDVWPAGEFDAERQRWTFVTAERVGESAAHDAAILPNGEARITRYLGVASLWVTGKYDLPLERLHRFDTRWTILCPPEAIPERDVLILAAPPLWESAGPNIPANPALSWEYWNGASWWALGAEELYDATGDFQRSGGVFFKVPADIEPTDVGGRKNHWIRARLVGGDYGEAKVTVKGDGGSGQVATRDPSTIRAPYVTSLKLGYCALNPVRPEFVLAEDSLGTVDQTSANEAGLDFPVFTPVFEAMNPPDPGALAAEAAADAARCGDPCPDSAASEKSPCDAPGAHDSCDGPCLVPPDYRRPRGAAAAGFVRGLMVGFARPFSGDTVSLYVDAEPTRPQVELAAEMLRAGRFVPINVVTDTSYGLTEPGIVTLALPDEPDGSDLFGASAHWLRLRPKADAAGWSPRLRAIHLNAVLARSVETRTMERLGASIGAENQELRLAEVPVEAGSLRLRVREALAEEERAQLAAQDRGDAKAVERFPGGPPGEWVLWTPTDDLIEDGEPQRVYTLDAERGVIRFGDGKTGRIPPLGAELLAARYAHVTGNRANGVRPGTQVQLLSPLAGVEAALALDHAAGGSDVESVDSAARRAAAKVRHGGRILTRADLEEHGLTLAPGIAQVRTERRGGGMRLIVAMAGAEARPSPAQLRQFAAALREVAGYGLARPGGLTVVGPRLMPIAVELVLAPRSPGLFAEAAEQAKARLTALFDPGTGNHDGKGWPIGLLPDAQDIAAALVPIDPLALPVSVRLSRADKQIPAEKALPTTIPLDVLVRFDPADIAFERAQEATA